MKQVYTRKSSNFRNSLTNTEKIIVENFKSLVNENKMNEIIKKWIKNWDKLVYTFSILVIYLNYGICGNLYAPAMVDLKFLYRTSMTYMSYGNTISSFGYLLGSLTGFLYKYINRQLSFIVNVVILGVFMAAHPICSSLWQFYVCIFLNGIGSGVWDSGNAMWIVEMWKDHSSPVLQLSQMMYGCGAIIGPLMAKPYLYGDLSNKTNQLIGYTTTGAQESTTLHSIINTTTVFMNNTIEDDINYSVDRRSKLKIPFFIGGGTTLLIPVLLLVMFFVKRYKVPEKQTQTPSEKMESNLAINTNPNQIYLEMSPRTRKILIALVALSLNSYSGLENTFFNYSTTYYQYLPIRMSASTAAQVMSTMTATYAFGRGVSAIISSRLKAEIMLSYHMVIIFISFAVLYFGQNSEVLIYSGNALLGFGFSAMWPAYFAFSENYLKLTDKVTSIFSFSSVIFSLLAPFLIGPLIEEHPEVFFFIEIGLFVTVILIFIVIMVITQRSKRFPILYTINN